MIGDIVLAFERVQYDLVKIIQNAEQIDFREDHVIRLLYSSLCGLNFIHSAGLIHRDIKPANMLITEQCSVKLCDFGLSRTISDGYS